MFFFLTPLLFLFLAASPALSVPAGENDAPITIPSTLGRVTSSSQSPASGGRLIIVQDIHGHRDAAEQIAKILELLIRQYAVDTLAVEGAEGLLDLTLLHALPDHGIKKKMFRREFQKGNISAAEYIALTSKDPVEVFGVDKNVIYFSNVAEYRRLIQEKESYLKILREWEKTLDRKKEMDWPDDLKKLHRIYQKLYSTDGVLNIEDITFLKDQEIVHAPTGDRKAWMAAIALREQSAANASRTHKQTLDKVRYLLLAQKALALRLAPYELPPLKQLQRNVSIPPKYAPLRAHVTEIIRFYDAVRARDIYLARNAAQLMNKSSAGNVVLVVGGYHTEGIAAELIRRNRSFLVITPSVWRRGSHERYERQMVDGLTEPGTNLAPEPISTPARFGVTPVSRLSFPISRTPEETFLLLRRNQAYLTEHILAPYVRRMESDADISVDRIWEEAVRTSRGETHFLPQSRGGNLGYTLNTFKRSLEAADLFSVSPESFIEASSVTFPIYESRGFGSKSLQAQRLHTAANAIVDASGQYNTKLNQIMAQATLRFLTRDWMGQRTEEHRRLNLYIQSIADMAAYMRDLLGPSAQKRATWKTLKEKHFLPLINGKPNEDISVSFFNAVKSHFVPLDHSDFNGVMSQQTPYSDEHYSERPYLSFQLNPNETLEHFIWRILTEIRSGTGMPLEVEEGVRAVARKIRHHYNRRLLAHASWARVDFFTNGFFRNREAYLVGRIHTGINNTPYVPLVLSMAHAGDNKQIYINNIFTRHSAISKLFSQTQSHFHVVAGEHRTLVAYLQSLMPWKRDYTLYRVTGFNNLAKATLISELFRDMDASPKNRFEFTPGTRGKVMFVIRLRDSDLVIKIIKDHFDSPKTVSREEVKQRYNLVRFINRRGDLLDVQNFRNIRIPRNRFHPDVIKAFVENATQSVRVTSRYVELRQFYTMREVKPLDVFVKEMKEEMKNPARRNTALKRLRKILNDFGVVQENLARMNIFSGDQFVFNFGIIAEGTPNERVVLYDYDEIKLLTDLRFGVIPEPRSDDEEWMDVNEWFAPGPKDVFPSEFRKWFGIPEESIDAFTEAHGKLFGTNFWRETQDVLRANAGEFIRAYPYSTIAEKGNYGFGLASDASAAQIAGLYFQFRFGITAGFGDASRGREYLVDALKIFSASDLKHRQDRLAELLEEGLASSHWVFSDRSGQELLDRLAREGGVEFQRILEKHMPRILFIGESAQDSSNALVRTASRDHRLLYISPFLGAEELRTKLIDHGFYGVPLRYFLDPHEVPQSFIDALSPRQREQFEAEGARMLTLLSNYLLIQDAIAQAA